MCKSEVWMNRLIFSEAVPKLLCLTAPLRRGPISWGCEAGSMLGLCPCQAQVGHILGLKWGHKALTLKGNSKPRKKSPATAVPQILYSLCKSRPEAPSVQADFLSSFVLQWFAYGSQWLNQFTKSTTAKPFVQVQLIEVVHRRSRWFYHTLLSCWCWNWTLSQRERERESVALCHGPTNLQLFALNVVPHF